MRAKNYKNYTAPLPRVLNDCVRTTVSEKPYKKLVRNGLIVTALRLNVCSTMTV
jgi:hypothetical protein